MSFTYDKPKKVGPVRRYCDECRGGGDSHNTGLVKRRRNLAYEYGITLDQYNDMALSCENRCESCGDPAGNQVLHVDHDHSTGEVRGLLCRHCNLALGAALEDPVRLVKLADYIKSHQ